MKSVILEKKGKSKSDLKRCLEKLEEKYQKKISENNVSIKRNGNIISIYAFKKIILIKFWIDAKLLLNDGSITIEYDTNFPESYEKDAMKLIK